MKLKQLIYKALVMIIFAATLPVQAANYYWDGDTVTANAQDGGGTWDTATANWITNGSDVVWANNNVATFGVSADGTYAVTLATSPTATLSFNYSGYTLSAASAQTITFGSSTTGITVAPGKSATIGNNVMVASPSSGDCTIGVTTNSGGTLIIDSGGTVKNGGSNSARTLSINGTTVEVKTGGSLTTRLDQLNAIFVNGLLNVTGGTVTSYGTLGVGQVSTAGNEGTLTISSGNVTASSVNGLRFGGNNGTLGGNVNLDGGSLAVSKVITGTTAPTTAVLNLNGGTLKSTATSTDWLQANVTVNVKGGGALIDTTSGDVTIKRALVNGTGGSTDGGLTKNGNGILTLSGTNTYTGPTTVNMGKLQSYSPFSLPEYSTPGKLSVAATGTLHLNVSTSNEWSSADIDTLLSNNGSGFSPGSSLSLDTSNGAATNLSTFNVSNLNLVKTGPNMLLLKGSNSYTGLTTVASGVLLIEHGNALGTTENGTVALDWARIEMAGGFTMNGEPLTIIGHGGGNGYGALLSVRGTNTWAGPITLGENQARLGVNGGDLIVSGPIGDNGNNYDLLIRSANGNLTDTVTLSGVNTYGGRTIIYQGVVKIASGDNRLPVGSVLQLGFFGSGNSLTGQVDLNGCHQELAGLEVNSNIPDTQPDLRARQLVKNSSDTLSVFTLNTEADYTFTGRLVGNLGLRKKGNGIFTLSCTNAYSGATVVSGGTLRLTRQDCLSTNSTISIAASSSAKVDLAFTGIQTISTLSVDGKLLIRGRVYNATNLPSALSGTGNLRTTDGIPQGTMVQFF